MVQTCIIYKNRKTCLKSKIKTKNKTENNYTSGFRTAVKLQISENEAKFNKSKTLYKQNLKYVKRFAFS